MQILINMEIHVNAMDNYGMTALSDLYFPDTEEDREKITMLIKNGGDLNAVDNNKRSILMTAYKHERMDLVQLILEKGGDVWKKDLNGNTFWDMICHDQNKEIARHVLSYMDDVNFKDSDGTSPLINSMAL